MPEELWAAAVELAEARGVFAISRELGLSYKSLKSRVDEASSAERSIAREGRNGAASSFSRRDNQTVGVLSEKRRGGAGAADFIELEAAPFIGSLAPAEAVIELADAAGAKLTIRLAGRGEFDVAGLVGAFWRRGA